MARQKATVISEKITAEDANRWFAEYTRAQAQINKLGADMDVKITAIREKFDAPIRAATDTRDEAFRHLQKFAEDNPELFVKRKSMEFTHGLLGFRTGTPKLKTLKGFTFSSALNLIKEFMPEFIRTKEEIDRESIIGSRETAHVQENLKRCGLEIAQEEAFYVEPKLEEVAVPA